MRDGVKSMLETTEEPTEKASEFDHIPLPNYSSLPAYALKNP
jgi:hypothetical protein